MGHKRTLAKRTTNVCFTPKSGHTPSRPEMSAKCHKRTFVKSLLDLTLAVERRLSFAITDVLTTLTIFLQRGTRN
jgi:hypothetical protein